MVLERPQAPLTLRDMPMPVPEAGEVRLKVSACAVCRTDLHILDGDLEGTSWPIIPGHEIIGTVDMIGPGVGGFQLGDRLGVPWLGKTCGQCSYCRKRQENLCDQAEFTGYTRHGGFAEYTIADHRFCFPIPGEFSDVNAAPLMCAGLIGYRSYGMIRDAQRIGIYGFGAAAHIIAQIAVHEGREVYAFTRPDDEQSRDFAKSLGAIWAGDSTEKPPAQLDAALIFAPVGSLVPKALKTVRKGGTVVCAGIHMTDIPAFPYKDLWEERILRSVANLTRKDGTDFLSVAPAAGVTTSVREYKLEQANQALDDLRHGRFDGAAVLVMH